MDGGRPGKADGLGAPDAALGEPVLRSDEIRRELFGPGEDAAETREFGAGIYKDEAVDRVYGVLQSRAEEWLRSGRSAVVDATCRSRERRREFRRMAGALGAPVLFVECRCPLEIVRERLRRREGGDAGPSDARRVHLAEFLKRYEPPSEIPPRWRFLADTTRSPQVLAAEIFFAAKAAPA